MVKLRSFLKKYWPEMFVTLHFSKFIYLFHDISFTSGLPITNVDFSLYYARVQRAHEFLTRSGQIWGYDPFLMGGYVAGAVDGAGTFFVGWLTHILSGVLSIETSLLLIELTGYLILPFLLLPAIKNFGGTRNQAWTGFAIFVLMYGHFEYYTQGYYLYVMALFWFCWAATMAFWQVSLCWKWLHDKKISTWITLVVITIIATQIHPSVIVPILFPNILLYGLFWTKLSPKQHALILIGIFIVLVSNSYWMIPFMSFSDWLVSTGDYEYSRGWFEISRHLLPFKGNAHESVQYVLNTSLLVLAYFGLKTIKNSNKNLWILFVVWSIALFFIGYFGSLIPIIDRIQPHRFIYTLWILFFLLASFYLPGLLNKNKWRDLIGLLVVIAVPFGWWNMMVTNPKGSSQTTLDSSQVNLLQYISRIMDPKKGRLMIEMEEYESPEYAPPHIYDLIPIFTRQPLSIGPNPGNYLKTRFSDFRGVYWGKDDPVVFGKALKDFETQELKNYLNLYNIGYIFIFSDEAENIFSSHKNLFKFIGNVEQYRFFVVNNKPEWFMEGKGKVSFDYDKIEIENASNGPLVLKFHWIHTLKSNVHIEPVYFFDDPTPFIKLDNTQGIKSVKIWNEKL